MKKAFTLLELLVVIGILGILISIVVAGFAGSSDSAMAIRCETNLKSLANAAIGAGYPFAGSFEKNGGYKRTGNSVTPCYVESPGWISWYSNGAYKNKPTSHTASSSFFISAYDQRKEVRMYCLTNGSLWKAVNGNAEVFRCPCHLKTGTNPIWSYVMNAVCGWDESEGANFKPFSYSSPINWLKENNSLYAERRILFAEIPFSGLNSGNYKPSPDANKKNDTVLQYGNGGDAEVIGFNHSTSKRNKFALVVFFDGHTERIKWPQNGLDESAQQELTKWLCTGTDYTFNGKKFEEAK